jgi:hypothetical protein
MDVEIGMAAGDVYRFIEANGPATVTRLKKGTGHKDAVVCQALGWLAREDKVVREVNGRSVTWTLAKC